MHMSAAGAAEESDEEYYEEEAGRGEAAPDDGDYVELDLERTLTWAGNAVSIQAGSEFRMPLLVPYPAVLAIQFEVDGGADIEFSLKFKEDAELEESMLVEPTRVSDREGQLDIDTTGTCEIIWSNAHAWMSAKTLSYQLQLAPKLDVRWKRRLLAAVTASTDFRMLAAVEAADRVDESMKSIKSRTAQLQRKSEDAKAKAEQAQMRYERYVGHVRRLEEEVVAAKGHVEAARKDLEEHQQEALHAEDTLDLLEELRHIDDGLNAEVIALLRRMAEPLEMIFEAYAGSLYADEDDEDEDGGADGAAGARDRPKRLDRAELIHFLQDFEVILRGSPPEEMCGVFVGSPAQLGMQEFTRCFARVALALAPLASDGSNLRPIEKMRWLLHTLPGRAQFVKLPVLSVPRRVLVLSAVERIAEMMQQEASAPVGSAAADKSAGSAVPAVAYDAKAAAAGLHAKDL